MLLNIEGSPDKVDLFVLMKSESRERPLRRTIGVYRQNKASAKGDSHAPFTSALADVRVVTSPAFQNPRYSDPGFSLTRIKCGMTTDFAVL